MIRTTRFVANAGSCLPCVSFIAPQLKTVLDALKERGHQDNAVIIFMSDHGHHVGEHFLCGKVTLFDIGARAAFIMCVLEQRKPAQRQKRWSN